MKKTKQLLDWEHQNVYRVSASSSRLPLSDILISFCKGMRSMSWDIFDSSGFDEHHIDVISTCIPDASEQINISVMLACLSSDTDCSIHPFWPVVIMPSSMWQYSIGSLEVDTNRSYLCPNAPSRMQKQAYFNAAVAESIVYLSREIWSVHAIVSVRRKPHRYSSGAGPIIQVPANCLYCDFHSMQEQLHFAATIVMVYSFPR